MWVLAVLWTLLPEVFQPVILDSFLGSHNPHMMSKRLQVLLDDKELRDIQRIAKQKQMTVAEWVRQVLRKAPEEGPSLDKGKKFVILRTAATHRFPTADIDQMFQEISQGYSNDLPT